MQGAANGVELAADEDFITAMQIAAVFDQILEGIPLWRIKPVFIGTGASQGRERFEDGKLSILQ